MVFVFFNWIENTTWSCIFGDRFPDNLVHTAYESILEGKYSLESVCMAASDQKRITLHNITKKSGFQSQQPQLVSVASF